MTAVVSSCLICRNSFQHVNISFVDFFLFQISHSDTEIKWRRVNTVHCGVNGEWFCFLIWIQAFGCSCSFRFLQRLCILDSFLSSLWTILCTCWLHCELYTLILYTHTYVRHLSWKRQYMLKCWSIQVYITNRVNLSSHLEPQSPRGPWRLQVHHMAISL